jgi:copper transport protein
MRGPGHLQEEASMTTTARAAAVVPRRWWRLAPGGVGRGTTTGRRLRWLVGLAGLVVLVTFGSAVPASAHAGLVGTEPTEGSVVDAPPRDLRLSFNEPVTPVAGGFTLYDSGGRYPASAGAPSGVPVTTLDAVVTAHVPAALPRGSYLLSWRVVSADSHPISGTLSFVVGEASAAPPAPPAAEPDSLRNPVNTLYLALQVLGYLGLLGAVGLSVFDHLVLTPPERSRLRDRLLTVGVVLAVVAYALLLPLTVLREQGERLGRVAAAAAWQDGWTTSAAGTLALAAAGGLLLVLGGRLPRASGRVVGLTGALVAVASVLPTGHTRTYGPSWLVVGLDLVHAATAAVWFGGLVGLAVHLVRARRSAADPVPAAAVVARFSTLAGALVGLLGLSGVGLAVIILGSFRAALGTDYGHALLVKLALVGVIALLAVWNRVHLVKAVQRRTPPEAQWRRLRGAVLDEAALLVAVLAVTGLLTMQSPTVPTPPDAGSNATAPRRVELGTGSLQGQVLPARVGVNTFEFTLRDADGAPLESDAIPEVSASLPAQGLGPSPVTVERLGGTSRYRADLRLPVAGEWRLLVSIRLSKFDAPTTTLDVPIAR